MIILLRNIPASTRNHEVLEFLEPELKGGLFSKKGTVSNIKILLLNDKDAHAREFHGLISIDQEAVAKRIITKLNRKPFKGRRIVVREYMHRTWHNDRRIDWDEMHKLKEKRQGDRRRKHLEVVVDIANKFSGQRNFHRKLE